MSEGPDDVDPANLTTRAKLRALAEVATYRPALTAGILGFALLTAALEGVGVGFILPIIDQVQGNGDPSGPVRGFERVYDVLGVPFSLATVVLGVILVMGVRFAASFCVQWFRGILEAVYVRHLREAAFGHGLDARVAYFDRTGSDELMNAVITQTRHAGEVIHRTVSLLEVVLTGAAYLLIATYISPVLTLVTGLLVGAFTVGVRRTVESGTAVGERVADANERVQGAVQDGMQGIREVKLFDLGGELYGDFQVAVDQFVAATIARRRNKAAIRNAHRFATAAVVFGLVYVGVAVFELSLERLGVFLFAMFRLGPKVSHLNDGFYALETQLPHLVRTQSFTSTLRDAAEPDAGEGEVPPVDTLAFEDVSFSYDAGDGRNLEDARDEQVLEGASDERILEDVSFTVDRGEFVAFVGQSGAGKSTVVSLLARLYEPDDGEITADGTPIDEYDVEAWRRRIAVVRQDPYLFDDTLRANITVGNRDASRADVERVAAISRVTEFLDDLPAGYETPLGEDGVRLSGGQRQRVAIARALLKDADLLVLDEATSDLDTHLEAAVHDAIESMERDYAILAIAHRLSTVTDADRIYTMDDGRIVESGTHEELVADAGQYAGLYTSQS